MKVIPQYKVIGHYYDRIKHNIEKKNMLRDIGQTNGKMHLV